MKHLTKPERAIVARLGKRWNLDPDGVARLAEWLELFRELDRKRWFRQARRVVDEIGPEGDEDEG